MPIPRRGMRDIRTHSGRATREPHKAFMEISCLEMEKSRRGKERALALERVRMIEERFLEIAGEERRLLEEAGVSLDDLTNKRAPSPRKSNSESPRSSSSETPPGGFKIKY